MVTPMPAVRTRSGKYPGYWTIKKIRRGLRNRVNAWLARHAAPARQPARLDPAQIRRVIVCRRNNRLGNMLFLTPLLHSLAATLPHAEIDVLIGNARFTDLFERMPGVRKVWALPARGWLWPLRMLRMLFSLRAQHYDLSVEPSLNSFSNRLSARLCGARWSLGFHSPDQWLSLTHAVTPDPLQRHEVLRPLQLVRQGFQGNTALLECLDIALSEAERAEGKAALAGTLPATTESPVIGFFIEATGKKRLPPEWWHAWRAALQASGRPLRLVQLLPPDGTPALDPGLATLCETNHRRLASQLAQLDLFVSCDAGPMHLASAAGTATLGLFHATRSERYRPLGPRSAAVDVRQRDPAQVAALTLRHLASGAPIRN